MDWVGDETVTSSREYSTVLLTDQFRRVTSAQCERILIMVNAHRTEQGSTKPSSSSFIKLCDGFWKILRFYYVRRKSALSLC